ncbi:Aprataxin and PNK-like factor [Takifugu flavidus]|uniref:Aprataxin and PNK-like factor n=1 Tax=Takifugu flavidus TaxID=433684 RepID=A0A5C6MXL2_9TELE|nr:Aprataxin and PNK-like factor [Takifugu flavidus]
MSGFDLVPVGGGEPIRLPPGETVIGRGPLLRTHMNPCFIQSSLTDDPRPLQKDSWFSLQDGDLFSLLPGQLIYRVVTVCDGDSSRNSQRVEEKLPLSPKPDVEPLSAPRCAETPPPEEPTEAPPPQHHQVSPVQTVNKENMMSTEVTPKRRMLPAWMMAAVTAPHGSPSFSSKDQRATTSSKRQNAAKKPKMTSAEEEQEEHSEEDKPKKKRNVQGDEEQWHHGSLAPSYLCPETRYDEDLCICDFQDVPVVPLSSTADLSDESDSFSVEAHEEERQGPNTSLTTGKLAVAQLEDRKFKKTTIANSKICSPSSPLSTPRMPCPYGKECYRKNPVHFQESSHPGDADYKEEEPEDVERPECPYGTDCYRKNPLHRKEYKHTKKPAYNTRPRLKAAAEEDGVEDSDDDDSFINDDSEDGGDDSDYVPPDSDDSGKEDIRRLQREAQAFLKKGK